MAKLITQCSVLTHNAQPCAHLASYTCSEWHLICDEHKITSFELGASTCPLCVKPLVHFIALEHSLNQGWQENTAGVLAMSAFFRDAWTRFQASLQGEPTEAGDTDLEDEM